MAEAATFPAKSAESGQDSFERSKVHYPRQESSVTEAQPASQRPRTSSTSTLLQAISERDALILGSIAEFRLLSTTQIRELHFSAHASKDAAIQATWAVLRRLEERRLLQRVGRQRRFAVGGSTPVTWGLDTAGERVTRFLGGEPKAPRRRNLLPEGDEYHHTLTVADTFLRLVRSHRTGRIDLVEVRGEPAAWRNYPGQLGRAITLKPDLALITQTPEYRDHWFVEVDLGNQSIPRLIRKCQRYEQYRASGLEQQRLGVFPRVVWVMPNEHRADRLRAAIASERELRPGMFLVTVPDRLIVAISDDGLSSPMRHQFNERRRP